MAWSTEIVIMFRQRRRKIALDLLPNAISVFDLV